MQAAKSPVSAAVLCAAIAGWSPSVAAQTTEPWQFGLSIYGWLPSISGTTTFAPPPGGSDDITVDAEDILGNLKFVFMGTFEARKDRWGGFTDFVYLNVGDSKSQSRSFLVGRQQVPADVAGNLSQDLKGYIWTLAGEYRVMAQPASSLDAFAGARMAKVEQRLDYTLSGNVGALPIGTSGTRSVDLRHWDAIVGVKGRWSFGEGRRWFVPYYADIGAGESDLTYQVLGGIGYSFGWGELVGQWRYLGYDFGTSIEKLTFNGPAIAMNFRW